MNYTAIENHTMLRVSSLAAHVGSWSDSKRKYRFLRLRLHILLKICITYVYHGRMFSKILAMTLPLYLKNRNLLLRWILIIFCLLKEHLTHHPSLFHLIHFFLLWHFQLLPCYGGTSCPRTPASTDTFDTLMSISSLPHLTSKGKHFFATKCLLFFVFLLNP